MWESRSDFQPQARVWNGCGPEGRPAGAFPVDPEGERSEFREAESSRKSISLSMPCIAPGVGRDHGSCETGAPIPPSETSPPSASPGDGSSRL